MVRPDFFVSMWDRQVGIVFMEGIKDPTSADFFGEVVLTVPDPLHQQLEGKQPLKIIIREKLANTFVPDEYDTESNRYIYTARFVYSPEDTITLMTGSLHTKFAEWKANETGNAQLLWKTGS